MNRLTRELTEADVQIKTAKVTNTTIQATLDAALAAASNCQHAYLGAPGHVRRQINQGFFERLLIGDDGSVAHAKLTEPFAALLDGDRVVADEMGDTVRNAQDVQDGRETEKVPDARTSPSGVFLTTYGDKATQGNNKNTHRTMFRVVGGVNQQLLVGAVGIEPTTKWL